MINELKELSWHPSTRILFRFFFLYFVLYIIPFPLTEIPFPTEIDLKTIVWTPLIEWVGIHVLKTNEISILPNGSWDTTWNYVQVFTISVVAGTGTVIWTIVDRRTHYRELFYALTVGLRYFVAVTLIRYGLAKMVHIQFPLATEALLRTYLDSSPMGLLWTFMSFSPAYNFFTGCAEALGGFLLFFRPTKMIGALLNLAVLSNIVMLNFTYDVPVKLFSSHLLIMNIVLLIPDLSRLIDFFILNRPTAASLSLFQLKRKNSRIVYFVSKSAFVVTLLTSNIVTAMQHHRQTYPDRAALSPFGGVYEVGHHIINHDTLSLVGNDTKRWKKLTVSWKAYLEHETIDIQYMDGAHLRSYLACDTSKKQMKFVSLDSTTVYDFGYMYAGDNCQLKGLVNNDSVTISMRKITSHSELLERRFHWINETPYYK